MNTLLTLLYIARATMMHTLLKPGLFRPVGVVLTIAGRLVLDPFAAVLEVLVSLRRMPPIGLPPIEAGEPSVCLEQCPCCGMHIPLTEGEV